MSLEVHTAHVGDSRAILARVADGANGGKCFIARGLKCRAVEPQNPSF